MSLPPYKTHLPLYEHTHVAVCFITGWLHVLRHTIRFSYPFYAFRLVKRLNIAAI